MTIIIILTLLFICWFIGLITRSVFGADPDKSLIGLKNNLLNLLIGILIQVLWRVF